MPYAFTHVEVFLSPSSSWDLGLWAEIKALGLGFGPRGWDLSLEAGIWALRLGFGPRGLDLSLEAGIWALRLTPTSLGNRME